MGRFAIGLDSGEQATSPARSSLAGEQMQMGIGNR
jgi:hypothetical protein